MNFVGRFQEFIQPQRKNNFRISVLYCLAYSADDDSCIYVVETSSFKTYCGLILLLNSGMFVQATVRVQQLPL